MQKIIRRTALARNQAQRKAIRASKNAEREDLKDTLRQRFAYERMELDNVRAERQRRREDWLRGPLAPHRDAGFDGKHFGALSPQAMNPPAIPKHMRRKYINIAAGDRVCIMKGKDKGKINEVIRVDANNETVMVKDLNMADVHFPEWLNEQYGNKSPFHSVTIPIPIDEVRLVVALDDPITGSTRDVLVEHVYGGEPLLEREHGTDTPRHTRYISGEDIEIPWPRSEPPAAKDEDADTLRMEVETPTWMPSLQCAPFPPSVLDELRNKFSKYRTRHDPEWAEQKKMEDYRREYLQSRSLLTPKGELIAMIKANKKERLDARRDENGNMIMDDQTAGFIENFMRQRSINEVIPTCFQALYIQTMAFASINTAATNSIPAIEHAFAAEPSLKKRVYDAIGSTPQHIPLFEDIARYTSTLLARNTNAPIQPVEATVDGPLAKKRKIQNGDSSAATPSSGDLKADAPLQFYMRDVSFAIPQRKKLTLEITGSRGFLRARNQTSTDVEFGVPVDKIQHVLCLPVPEKNQKQFNFCIIPQYADGINAPPGGEPAPESIVWTVNDGPPKSEFAVDGKQVMGGGGESTGNIVLQVLNAHLSRTKVVRPDEREFVSAMPEAHRKGEKAYHVKAFRGSKEGYLFFLSTGILFGFKKPLIFFAFENVDSISYTSVLQRTFNLNVTARSSTSDEPQEFEFSMVDQANFGGIDSYIKKHGLQDASLAEERRARRYNINGKQEEDAAATTGGVIVEEESELQKAQRELEDQEDEDEEDYDPGSDDESDGSGSSSEEDDDDEDNEDDEDGAEDGGEDMFHEDQDEDRDLVANELGSEAEDLPDDQL
ncbi:hypothetical protein FE257_011956 [Aspergillus nanangensis]|uniref:Histone chaperone RTT106/FACT complex subunit SPT16-like middle domain-containing protein n=1 Tax=Aspergillus nanangensis TaxID=2582783 RepID=A0AAD4CI84_ASPNN|nr:hypothetical protein FE257_011956 [Aspergillus nanangensis]